MGHGVPQQLAGSVLCACAGASSPGAENASMSLVGDLAGVLVAHCEHFHTNKVVEIGVSTKLLKQTTRPTASNTVAVHATSMMILQLPVV